MQSISIHTSVIAANQPPVYFAINHKKTQRYILCLQMVGSIVKDFLPDQKLPLSFFETLGKVACCIDNHLDDLDIEQKKKLLELFPSFFMSLASLEKENDFSEALWKLCDRLGTSLYPPSLCTDLFQFYCFCKKENLVDELQTFSLLVIQSAIAKTAAKNGNEVLQSLALEGNAAVSFLIQLLQKETDANDRVIMRLKNYLGRLEKMLNIADDLTDYKKDKLKKLVTVHAGTDYYLPLSAKLLKTFFSTTLHFHFLFGKHFIQFTVRYLRSEFSTTV